MRKKLILFLMLALFGSTSFLRADEQTFDFEGGLMDWTTIDADGDGYVWEYTPYVTGHNGSTGTVISNSYDNNFGALTPDNYLVSPTKAAYSQIHFWACAQDASWAAEHFGVAVSTGSNTSATGFTTVEEWTMTAKGSGIKGVGRNGATRDQGTWYEYTVDLSAYNGQDIWVAIRHFNCTDQFILVVDDVTLTTGAVGPGPGPTPPPTPGPTPGTTVSVASMTIDFETGDFSQYEFTNDATYPWTVETLRDNGTYCIKSGNASVSSSSSTIEAEVEYVADGTVSFDALCQGEGTSTAWDKCIFSIDGNQQFAYGAHVSGWNNYSFDVTEGTHTFTWSYTKDGSVNPTGDCFMVDNITFDGVAGEPVAPGVIVPVPGFEPWVMGDPDATLDTLMLLLPEDGAMNVNIDSLVYLQWITDADAAEYKIEFGSTYPPAVLVDWTAIDETYPAAPSYYDVTDLLLPNTHYFWRISIRNNANTLVSDLWGFTTLMDIPTDVTATPYQIFTDESTVISWTGANGGGGGGSGFSGEITVCDGTATSSYIPVYGLWMDDYTRSEMIYPADMLAEMNGGAINSLTFYISQSASALWTPDEFDVYLMEVDATTMSSYYTSANATVVYHGALDGTGTEMVVNFDTPYVYQGGNLLVGFEETVIGTYKSCYFYGVEAAGASASGYNASSLASVTFNQRDFLPKTTFTCGAKGGRSLRGYNVYVNGTKVNADIVSGNNYTLSNLAYNMNGYMVTVTSVHDEGESPLSAPDTLYVSGYGQIHGAVTADMSGTPLAGVAITFKGTDEFDNAVQYTATTGADGTYTIENVKVGVYDFGRAKLSGFEPRFLEAPETLAVDQDLEINFTLHTVYAPVDMVYAYELDETTAKIQWSFNHFTPYVPVGPTPGPGPGPGPGGNASTFTVDFENGMPTGWTTVDANNDGYDWVLGSEIGGVYLVSGASLAGTGHNASGDMICSGSYSNATGAAITPDNYLVSPQVTLASGSTFSFWACAQDASYAAEHYGVFVSDNGTSDWSMVQEWTMSAKGSGMMSIGRNGVTRDQGNWYQKTVDLSAYAGQKYIAIRHFNCNDQFILNVDDIELSAGKKGVDVCAEWVGTNVNSPAANRAMWDYVSSFSGTSAGQQAVATDGSYIYTASWQSAPTGGYTFYKYDLMGNFIEGFNISGATGIRDLTYDGTYFYGTSGGANLFILDLANQTMVGQISCSGLTSRHVSYDPVRDGFWSGNWTTLALYDRNGALVQSGPAPTSAYGSAYYKDAQNVEHLYLFSQPSSDAKVFDYNITTNTIETVPVLDFAGTPGFDEGIAGGAFIGNYSGKVCFFGNVQQDPNLIGIYELSANGGGGGGGTTTPTDITFNLYKKTVVTEVMPAEDIELLESGLTDTIAADFTWISTNPGLYQYGVQVVYPVPSKGRASRYEEVVDFEDGQIPANFVNSASYPWTVTTGNGGHAMKSGNGSVASSTSAIEVTYEFPSDGSITFDAECMGEGTSTFWDKCEFYIDNQMQFQYGANNPGWHNYSYPVAEGTHTFKWSYSKDSSVNPTGDYMMVDNIVFEYEDLTSNDDPNTEIVWSNMLPKWMDTSVELTAHVSTGTIEGAVVTFTNLVEDLVYTTTLDETGYVAYEEFRKGEYNLKIEQPGFTTYDENVSIWDNESFDITLEEDFVPVTELVVSGTGFARWTDMLPPVDVAQRYHVILEDALQGLTTDNYMQLDVENLTVGETYTAGVAVIYSTGMSDFVYADFVYTGCEATDVQVEDLEGTSSCMNVILTWNGGVAPTPGPNPGPNPPTPPTPPTGNTFDFDNGTMQGWTTIDANNDNYDWVLGSQIGGVYLAAGASLAGTGHNSSADLVCSGSFSNATGMAITPDNYLVSPTKAGYTGISFWACAQDASYAAEHFGVAVSTGSNTNASDFTIVNEWTMTAKDSGVMSVGRNGQTRAQGSWHEYTVDLSAYAGQDIWVAIRHFNCNDQFILNVDDITLGVPEKGVSADAEACGTTIATEPAREMWDLVHSFSLTSAGQQGIATDGNFIYTCSWQSSPTGGYNYYKYDLQGNFIEGFNIAGAGEVRDLTYDGQYFYGSSGSSSIYILDLANQTKVGQINCSGLTARHCTYDPVRDGFWAGNWSTLALYDRTGALIQNGPAPESAYGSGYFKDAEGVEHLYLFCQPSSDAKVYDYNITTNTLNSAPVFDFASTPGFSSGISGGAFVGNYNGLTCFFGNAQQDPNLVGIYELGAAQGGSATAIVPGKFNIFMDGELIANTSDAFYVYEAEDTEYHTYEVYYVDEEYNFSCPAGVEVAAGNLESVTELDYTMEDPFVTLTWNGTAETYVIWRGVVEGQNVNLDIVGETTEMTFTDQLPAEAGYFLYIVQSVTGECESDLQEEINNQNYVLINYDDVNESEIVNAIYPNPTSGNITIKANGMTRISVINALGQMVYDAEVDADELVLNMGQYNAGIYMVSITTVNGTTVKRVVVTK